MATQISLLGFTPYTVDAISWTPIFTAFAYREAGKGVIENTGTVTVNLRTNDTDATHERALISGDSLTFDDGPRGTQFPPAAPICYAKAASGTGNLMVIER